MTAGRIEMHLHAALRKQITDYLVPETDGQHDLITACKELRMGRSNNSTTVWVTNDALGAALDICREWLSSDNGTKVQAAKSTLLRHELDHMPDDPSERRYEFKMAKSLAISVPQRLWFLEKDTDADPRILEDLKPLGWHSGGSGRVRPATLEWLLAYAGREIHQDHPAVKRSARKFIDTYTPVHTEAVGQIQKFEAGGTTAVEPEDQEQEDVPALAEVCEEEPAAVEAAPLGWETYRLSDLVNWLGLSYFYFGGLAKEPLNEQGPLVVLDWNKSRKGRNELVDVDGGEIVATVHSMSKVWAARAKRPLETGPEGNEDLPQRTEAEEEGPELQASEDEPKAGEVEWRNTELRELPYRLRGQRAQIIYGGRAGRRNPEPTARVWAGITYAGEGRYDICDLGTGDVLATVMLDSRIWWAPLPLEKPEELVVVKDQGPEESREELPADCDEPKDQEETPLPARPRIPENFLFMAENANTPDARAWWARKVAAWGQQ